MGSRVGKTARDSPAYNLEGPKSGLTWPKIFDMHVLCHGKWIGPGRHGQEEAVAPFLTIMGDFGCFLARFGPCRPSWAVLIITLATCLSPQVV